MAHQGYDLFAYIDAYIIVSDICDVQRAFDMVVAFYIS